MKRLYTALFYLILPFILIRLLVRNRKNPDVTNRLWERLGFYQQTALPSCLWLHAVSYGEAVAAEPLIKTLRAHYPELPFVITTMTATGAQRIQATWQKDEQIQHIYVPYDLPFALNRFISHFNPVLVILMETEMWPNLLYVTGKSNLPVIIANARLSAKSLAGYQRIEKFMLPFLGNINSVAAQSALDAKHFKELGIADQRVQVTGNLKFDIEIPTTLINLGKTFRKELPHDYVLVAASTHANEEEQLLEIFGRLRNDFPNLLLVLAPRHPYRFDEVATLCQRRGYAVARRSQNELPDINTPIFLGDSMGELYMYYSLADVAFVGGSLIPVGGHNLLEPAAARVPIVTGPHLFNFTAISSMLASTGSLSIAQNLEELYQNVAQLLNDQERRELAKEAGFQVFAQNQGATANHLLAIRALISDRIH